MSLFLFRSVGSECLSFYGVMHSAKDLPLRIFRRRFRSPFADFGSLHVSPSLCCLFIPLLSPPPPPPPPPLSLSLLAFCHLLICWVKHLFVFCAHKHLFVSCAHLSAWQRVHPSFTRWWMRLSAVELFLFCSFIKPYFVLFSCRVLFSLFIFSLFFSLCWFNFFQFMFGLTLFWMNFFFRNEFCFVVVFSSSEQQRIVVKMCVVINRVVLWL